MLVDCSTFSITNIYFPYYDPELNNNYDKYENVCKFYEFVSEYFINKKNLIIVGDFNAVYKLKDHYQFLREYDRIEACNKIDKKKNEFSDIYTEIFFNDEENKIEKRRKPKTELPYYFKNINSLKNYFFEKFQRAWMKTFLEKNNLIDVWDSYYPDIVKYTCWNQILNLRPNDLGTRIDYILVTNDLIEKIRNCEILNDIYGSDHCPVLIDIDLEILQKQDILINKRSGIFAFMK